MKKVLFLGAAMCAAVALNAQEPVVWHATNDADSVNTVVAEANVPTEFTAIPNLSIVLLDGAANWTKKGAPEGDEPTFVGQDGVTYSKAYAQAGTNGQAGHLNKEGAVSAHIELTPAVAGTIHVAAKYGKNKAIWAAKVPAQVIEDEELNYADLTPYLIPGFSEASSDGTSVTQTKAMYIKDDGTGLQEVVATDDVFTSLPLEVEPGYTYFFWVSGSKIMLSGISFLANPEEGFENTNANAPKATKVIENGQVVIIRGDVRYNALGTVIE